ncbi:MAG: UvrB/UvrC motif-containing protein [Candidatus Staskawiczbacteria bacterium]|nr:UvrB/UvrC motif-containing protein [Candidatus Staskawiczbacteria bacterium]
MDGFKFLQKKQIDMLPKTAGVYALASPKPKGEGGFNVLYIGKAINIKSRVKNHFQPARNASLARNASRSDASGRSDAGGATFKDNILSKLTTKVGFLETGSEIEALILEANLIKKYQPKYNVMWRDDKNYFYVAIAQNEQKIPYVFITHQPNFSSLRERSEATDEAIQSYRLPRRLRAPRNDGVEYIGPFVEGTALKKTLKFLRRAFPFYTSKNHPKTRCTWCHLDLCPGPVRNSSLAGEIYNGAGHHLNLAEYKRNIKKLILILKGKRGAVLTSLKKEMRQLAKESKFEEAGKIRDRLYALQQIMAHTHVIENSKSEARNPKLNEILAKIIGLKKPVNKIECYDVSNIQGKYATSSMVVFTNGKPDKNQYRKFKIKMKNEPNDIAMLKETLKRRFSHPEWKYPEVILIDGGKAQLNVALSVILNLIGNPETRQSARTLDSLFRGNDIGNIKVISIAKGRQDPLRPRSEARLFIENKKLPIPLKALPQEVYNLIKQLDDEAHRFAITYHKKLRKKNLLK